MRLLILLSVLLLANSCSKTADVQLQEIPSVAGDNSSLPSLYTDNTGTVFMSWVEEREQLAELKYASFENSTWSEPTIISDDSTWFLNWADYPSIIGKDGQPMAAHWLNKKPGGTYAYDVNISAFNNEWTERTIPHQDETATEHGFLSMLPASDSTFMAVWLDGRKTAGRDHHEYADLSKAMTLRGAIIDRKGQVIEKFLIDDSVCDCCNTSLAKTESGFIVNYRNRTEDEIRDIYSSVFRDGRWSEPKVVHKDNWEIAACPVNGPAIDAHNKIVATSWFTGANGQPKVQLGISNDFGLTYDTVISVDGQHAIGRTDILMNDDKIWVSWLSSVDDSGQLNLASYSLKGEPLEQYSIPNISGKRSTGFPQITTSDRGILIAFTDVSEEQKRIRMFELK
ncbi:MAG: hypothetical protein JJ953_09575 [Gracilimonas sp.]|uniref:hypothetical protein n=1 Tax=Gracilimonas TaxID=649462 RepID=UPI001B2A248F|nr:hypothetical protein [Gracilimonas sp.]MBO6586340.1 hypothetical protein [Gracilimonas sp.]MBO6614997.1 hypothetical protein [Gracilimonas sp.]